MKIRSLLLLPLLTIPLARSAGDESSHEKPEKPVTRDIPDEKLLPTLIGKWRGSCRTWFRPGELGDESKVEGEFSAVLGGRLVRHVYKGSMKGEPRHGEDLLAYNPVKKAFQSAWIDDFHMSYGILFSEGKRTEHGFSVRGEYDVGPGHPTWGWRTEFRWTDADHLTITAYNVTPAGEEGKAVEVVYERVR